MKIGIIGHGRFGKLWAELMEEFGEVFIFDNKQTTVNSKQFCHNIKDVLVVDILFLLVPISEIRNVCREIKDLLPEKTIVVDACSVKVKPVEDMKNELKNNQPIVATHPLFGPDSVKRMGLLGQKIAVCPIRVTESQLQILLNILEKLKLKIIHTIPEEHDKQMARSQALVHFLGRGLADLELREQEISTPDYDSLLKINDLVNNDTKQLFFDMQFYNPFAKEVREELIKSLQKLENNIKNYE